MSQSFPDLIDDLNAAIGKFREGAPEPMRGFSMLAREALKPGALDVKTKELCGLVASMVLRCDDCISYHVAQCKEAGVNRDEMFEAFSIGLVVGGSIVIPHLRRAVDFLDKLEQGEAASPDAHDHG